MSWILSKSANVRWCANASPRRWHAGRHRGGLLRLHRWLERRFRSGLYGRFDRCFAKLLRFIDKYVRRAKFQKKTNIIDRCQKIDSILRWASSWASSRNSNWCFRRNRGRRQAVEVPQAPTFEVNNISHVPVSEDNLEHGAEESS